MESTEPVDIILDAQDLKQLEKKKAEEDSEEEEQTPQSVTPHEESDRSSLRSQLLNRNKQISEELTDLPSPNEQSLPRTSISPIDDQLVDGVEEISISSSDDENLWEQSLLARGISGPTASGMSKSNQTYSSRRNDQLLQRWLHLLFACLSEARAQSYLHCSRRTSVKLSGGRNSWIAES